MPGQKFAQGDHRATHTLFQPQNVKRINAFLELLKPLAASHNCTLGQLILRWTIDQDGITTALAGARTSEQAIENAHATTIRLTQEERDFIRSQAERLLLT